MSIIRQFLSSSRNVVMEDETVLTRSLLHLSGHSLSCPSVSSLFEGTVEPPALTFQLTQYAFCQRFPLGDDVTFVQFALRQSMLSLRLFCVFFKKILLEKNYKIKSAYQCLELLNQTGDCSVVLELDVGCLALAAILGLNRLLLKGSAGDRTACAGR